MGSSTATFADGVPKYDQIYASVRADIISCALAPGQLVHEEDLTTRFRVSKQPVRDALIRLRADRLVTVLPRKGYRVAYISISDADELCEMCGVLEEAVARLAATAAPDATAAGLDRLCRGADVPDADFHAYDFEFHAGLRQACPNRRLAREAQDAFERLNRVSLTCASIAGAADTRRAVRDHDDIVGAIQAHDPAKSARLMNQHFERHRRWVRAALTRSPVSP